MGASQGTQQRTKTTRISYSSVGRVVSDHAWCHHYVGWLEATGVAVRVLRNNVGNVSMDRCPWRYYVTENCEPRKKIIARGILLGAISAGRIYWAHRIVLLKRGHSCYFGFRYNIEAIITEKRREEERQHECQG